MKQRIGIWGLGAVGKSAVHFFHRAGNPLEVLDLGTPENFMLQSLPTNIRYTQQLDNDSIFNFFDRNDVIITSPGINTTPFKAYAHKFITEFDIVGKSTQTPTIGITGTVGKTTVTTLISNLLQKMGYSIGTGGNIGTPMLDLITQTNIYDYLVLELSSFQLEYTRYCAPSLAIWTNFYPNHLDRHQNMKDYFLAKCNVFLHQMHSQHALLPLHIVPTLKEYIGNLTNINSHISVFSQHQPSDTQIRELPHDTHFFYFKNNTVTMHKNNQELYLLSCNSTTLKTYSENLLILAAALYCLGKSLDVLTVHHEIVQLEDRLEYVATHNNIHFYNDSKATIMQATHNALNALSGHNIILLLGGVSKGVDRTHDVQALAGKVRSVICFGKEVQALHTICSKAQISSYVAQTLEEAFNVALSIATSGDTILLSPGGASFDLFNNYQERGKRFKELMKFIIY